MNLSDFRTDVDKEQEGTWIPIGKGRKLKIARFGNPRFKEVYRQQTKPYQRQIRSDNLPDDIADKILAKCMVESILLDWEGLIDDDTGKVIPYSKKTAMELLTDPQYKDFRDLVSDLSKEAEAFRKQDMEEAEKN